MGEEQAWSLGPGGQMSFVPHLLLQNEHFFVRGVGSSSSVFDITDAVSLTSDPLLLGNDDESTNATFLFQSLDKRPKCKYKVNARGQTVPAT